MGSALLGFFVTAALAHPILMATVWRRNQRMYNPVSGTDVALSHPSPPSLAHWFGTDSLGRDVFSMFTYAAQPAMVVAITAAVVIGTVSLILGSVAAYRRGWVDTVISHISDAMLLLPALLAVLILGIGQGENFGTMAVGASFGFIYALGPATATVRTAALTVTARSYIDAARISGGGTSWLLTRHVWPHLVPHVATQVMLGVSGAVIAEAFLQYFSAVGEITGHAGFGAMIYDGMTWSAIMAGVAQVPWNVMLAGAFGITGLAASFFLIGVGLREAFDPRRQPRGT